MIKPDDIPVSAPLLGRGGARREVWQHQLSLRGGQPARYGLAPYALHQLDPRRAPAEVAAALRRFAQTRGVITILRAYLQWERRPCARSRRPTRWLISSRTIRTTLPARRRRRLSSAAQWQRRRRLCGSRRPARREAVMIFGFRAAVGCAANDDGRGCAALNVIAAGGKAAAVLPRATEMLHAARRFATDPGMAGVTTAFDEACGALAAAAGAGAAVASLWWKRRSRRPPLQRSLQPRQRRRPAERQPQRPQRQFPAQPPSPLQRLPWRRCYRCGSARFSLFHAVAFALVCIPHIAACKGVVAKVQARARVSCSASCLTVHAYT